MGGDHREILHQAHAGLPHQQEDHREVALIPSKPLRNKIAGFITHLMKRLQRSTVRGISIKLQEEERERSDNYVPDVSALEQDIIEVDAETKEMLKTMDFQSIPGLQMTTANRTGSTELETLICSKVEINLQNLA